MPAPVVTRFGDGSHAPGETGLTIDGAGFEAFDGEVWLFENQDRTGASDQLTFSGWNDQQISGVDIPDPTNNALGLVYLAVKRIDLAWSPSFAVFLDDGSGPSYGSGRQRRRRLFWAEA